MQRLEEGMEDFGVDKDHTAETVFLELIGGHLCGFANVVGWTFAETTTPGCTLYIMIAWWQNVFDQYRTQLHLKLFQSGC